GHAHHLEQARAQSGCTHIVCVMSGTYTQRGEAALVDKWTRAAMALECGADVVFELPTLFAVRDAQRFAFGGVSLLHSLGVCDALSFGCENPEALRNAEALLLEDPERIRQGLAKGQTLARARGLPQLPNLILALEYLRALRDIGSAMRPVPVARLDGYHDPTLKRMASASAIRAALWRGEDVGLAMPPKAHRLLMEARGRWHRPDALDSLLLGFLRVAPEEALRSVADVSEGLERRILACAQTATSRAELLDQLKCKRYTRARLSRVLTQALLGMDKALADSVPKPGYARLLGFRRQSAPLLRQIQDRAAIPIVTRPAAYRKQGDPVFALDLRAGDLWALGCADEAFRAGRRDLTQGVIICDSVPPR
nr:nucleotidyltransferase family protein [Clostridia bacterium]